MNNNNLRMGGTASILVVAHPSYSNTSNPERIQ